MSEPPLHAATVLLAALPVTSPSPLHAQTTAAAGSAEAIVPPPPAQAQEANAGRLSFTGGLDLLSSYMFRGIRQDDRGIVGWPAVDIGVALFKGDGAVRTIGMNVGLWNSLHSGPTGLNGPTGKMWYESDFYSTVTLGLKGGVNVGTTYTAYISPNNSFPTVKEITLVLGLDDSSSRLPLAPYGLVAIEIGGQADGGTSRGTYLELGVKPGIAVFADLAGPHAHSPIPWLRDVQRRRLFVTRSTSAAT